MFKISYLKRTFISAGVISGRSPLHYLLSIYFKWLYLLLWWGITFTQVLYRKGGHIFKIIRMAYLKSMCINLYGYCLVWLCTIANLCMYVLERWFATLHLRSCTTHRILLCNGKVRQIRVSCTRRKDTFLS